MKRANNIIIWTLRESSMHLYSGLRHFLGVLVFVTSRSYFENAGSKLFCLLSFCFAIWQWHRAKRETAARISRAPLAICYAGAGKRVPLASHWAICAERIVISVFRLCVSAVATRWWCAAGPAFALGLHVGSPTVAALRRSFFTEPPTVPVA